MIYAMIASQIMSMGSVRCPKMEVAAMANVLLQPIHEARAEVERRQEQRANKQTDLPGVAAGTIADELTLIRAQMSVIRGVLVAWADRGVSPWAFWTVVGLLLVTFLILMAKSGGLLA